MDKVLSAAAVAVVLGALLSWERMLSGPDRLLTAGVVVCAVVAIVAVGIATVCALYEQGSGNEK
jgi:hypothetical protein